MVTASQAAESAPDQLLRAILHGAPNDDLHALLGELRETAPVHRSALGPVWVLTRHADVQLALRDPRIRKGDASVADILTAPGFATRAVPSVTTSPALVFLNPPDHTRLRSLVSAGFTPTRVEAMRPRIEAVVEALLDAAEREAAASPEGVVEVMSSLAFPLPVQVIGDLVGVPEPDQAQFRALVRASAVALEPGASDDAIRAADRAAKQMAAYFGSLVTERKKAPTDDLISALLAVRDGDEKLTRRELVVTVTLLFSAGFETTMNLIGNGLSLVLSRPEARAGLLADPGLIGPMIEEVLRYESPVQVDGGIVAEPICIGGIDVPVGEWVLTLLGAANRDPLVFGADADTFRIDRSPNPHLAFSSGIHFCLGAGLARLEGAVFFQRFLERFPRARLVDPTPAWRPGIVFRGVERLPIQLDP